MDYLENKQVILLKESSCYNGFEGQALSAKLHLWPTMLLWNQGELLSCIYALNAARIDQPSQAQTRTFSATRLLWFWELHNPTGKALSVSTPFSSSHKGRGKLDLLDQSGFI